MSRSDSPVVLDELGDAGRVVGRDRLLFSTRVHLALLHQPFQQRHA